MRPKTWGWTSAPFFATYDRWKTEILNYFDARQTSAAVEGINNKARVITKRAYGLKSADSLWNAPDPGPESGVGGDRLVDRADPPDGQGTEGPFRLVLHLKTEEPKDRGFGFIVDPPKEGFVGVVRFNMSRHSRSRSPFPRHRRAGRLAPSVPVVGSTSAVDSPRSSNPMIRRISSRSVAGRVVEQLTVEVLHQGGPCRVLGEGLLGRRQRFVDRDHQRLLPHDHRHRSRLVTRPALLEGPRRFGDLVSHR